MPRRKFLFGMLLGAVLVAAVAGLANLLTSQVAVAPAGFVPRATAVRPSTPTMCPRVVVELPYGAPSAPLPRGSDRFEFNGMPVFIVPLGTIINREGPIGR